MSGSEYERPHDCNPDILWYYVCLPQFHWHVSGRAGGRFASAPSRRPVWAILWVLCPIIVPWPLRVLLPARGPGPLPAHQQVLYLRDIPGTVA